MQTSIDAALLQALPRDGLSVASDVATVAVGVAVVLLALVTAALLWRLRRAIEEVRIGVRQNLGPVSDRARSISDNVEFITQALRTDVERLNTSVKALTDRLHLASDRMEERIEEFNALMEVVQDEAEGIFLDTASTVRGVRAGARSIANARQERNEGADRSAVPARADSEDAKALAAEEA
jgi:hypothetical protein